MRSFLRLVIAFVLLLSSSSARTEPYAIQKGDTLYRIAMDHGVTYRALLRANPELRGKDPRSIMPGQVIVIPEVTPDMPADLPPVPPTAPPPPANLAADIHDGIANGGWIVSRNPNLHPALLFIHNAQREFVYFALVKGDGQWTIYDSSSPPGLWRSTPLVVMAPPSAVSISPCTCVPLLVR